MEFGFTQEQKDLRKTVNEFMKKECPPEFVKELDAKGLFPYDFYNKTAKMGFNRLPYPKKYNGKELGAIGLLIIGEEISRSSYEIATGFGMSVFSGLNILDHGTEKQKEYYLPKILDNELRFSVGITEPHAGSDAAALSASAVLDGDEWVINGHKTFQTTAHAKNTIINVYVRTDESLPKYKGISLILVPNDAPGVKIESMDTLGRKILKANDVYFKDVRVPKENLVGELNGGFKVLLSGLDLERLYGCATYIGATQTVVDVALERAKTREQFDRPIGTFQSIGHMLADMQTEVDAARLLTYRAAWMHDQDMPCKKEVSMAKLFGSEMYAKLSNQGMQIMGGYGYTMQCEMQRHFRDSRIVTLAAGSSQMQRNVIAKQMGLKVV